MAAKTKTTKRTARTLSYGERLTEDGRVVKDPAAQEIIREILAEATKGYRSP